MAQTCKEGVLGALQNSILCQCMCNFILRHDDILLENLDRNQLGGALVACEHDLAKRALAQHFHHLKIVQRKLLPAAL